MLYNIHYDARVSQYRMKQHQNHPIISTLFILLGVELTINPLTVVFENGYVMCIA